MPSERIRLGEDYYLLASALAPRRPKVFLSHGPGFAIFDQGGDVPLGAGEAFGIFHHGTRFLDRWELRIDGEFPVLLSSTPADDGAALVTWLTNADERRGGDVLLERDTIAIQRTKALCDGVLHEQLDLKSYASRPLSLTITVLFGADFADEFEVRGVERTRRGAAAAPVLGTAGVRFGYLGLDGVARATDVAFAPAPDHVEPASARFAITLPPHGATMLQATVRCLVGDATTPSTNLAGAVGRLHAQRAMWRAEFPRFASSNRVFDGWLGRSLGDIGQLRTEGPPGAYVKAGIPWFATVFGRDGLITALETLAFAPELSADVLRTLASVQGRTTDAERDEEPGKIVHELRSGEMAATGEVPFGRYYGSVDATPLFAILLAAYADRTADMALVDELWPNTLAAMHWIETRADVHDGYLSYARRTPRGLVHQGWKDSHDSVFHADGRLAEPPIALAEVQGYLFGALRTMAALATRTGHDADAARWRTRAEDLRRRFNRDFWMEDEGIFALALDADHRPCRVVSSNAGQCLWGGIVDDDKVHRVVTRLLRDDVFCGWGIRTISESAPRFNPMSYHNGSVWPHDNALIAAGFACTGATEAAALVLSGLFAASATLEDQRLPELFCGFSRTLQEKPVPYPVACRPQAWAAGSVLLLVQAVLGLSIDAWERRVTLARSMLPSWLERLDVHGLRVRDATLDLRIRRGRAGTSVEVLDRRGTVDVVVGR